MRKKIICLILCFFLIITTFLSSNVFGVNNFTSSTDDFYVLIGSESPYFPSLLSSDYYNPETDLLVFNTFNWRILNYGLFVLKNGKQYNSGDYKITVNYSAGGNIKFYGNTPTGVQSLLTFNYFQFNSNTRNWDYYFTKTEYGDFTKDTISFYKSDFNLYDNNTNLVITSKSSFDNLPFIGNTIEQLSNLSVGELCIGDNGIATSKIVISLFDDTDFESIFSVCLMDYPDYVSRIDLDDPFSDLGYVIPWSVFPEFNFIQGHQYTLSLAFEQNVSQVKKSFVVNKSIANTDIPLSRPLPTPSVTPTPDPNQGLIDSNKETQNILNDQTNAIKENTETNKNIFQKIGDILNLLNPLSENFFVYKLLELLFEGLKTFILPSSDFISNYFNELSSWFQERLGFLWTPFDIVNTFLERLNNNSLFVEPIIHIPNIVEPFTGQQLISATDYNLNSLLEKENFNTMYNVYLVIVDFIIYLGVLTLCYNTLVGVFRGSPDSITVVPSDDTNAYNRAVFNEKVSQYRKNIRKDKGGS